MHRLVSVTVGTVNAMHSLMAGLAGSSRWGSSLPKSFAEKGQFYRCFLIFPKPGICLVLIHIWEFDSKTIYEKLVVAIFYCCIMAKVGN